MDRLVGQLVTPPWPGPHPLVVLAPGSDAELVPASVPADVVARLSAAGIACLSYDRPGTGGSSGDWRLATVAEQALELEAAVDAGRDALGVDCGSIAICADGESGWAALRVVREACRPAALILVEVPVRGSVVRLQRDLGGRFLRQGFGAAEAALAGAVLQERIRRLVEGDPPTAVLGSEAACRSTPWYGLLPGTDPDEAVVLARRATHDAEPDLAILGADGATGPSVLAIGLDGGTGVDPDAPALDRVFAGSGDDWWTGSRMQHRAVTLPAGGGDTFWSHLGAVELIAGWVLRSGARSAQGRPESGRLASGRPGSEQVIEHRVLAEQAGVREISVERNPVIQVPASPTAGDRSRVDPAPAGRDGAGPPSAGRSLIDWVLSKTN